MSMIDKLRRIAQVIQIFRLPSLFVGVISTTSLLVIVFFSEPHVAEPFFIPILISLLWAISTYFFIVTFRSIPEKNTQNLRFIGKIKYGITRAGYWFLGLIFLGTTAALILATCRLVFIWLRDYSN